MFWRVRREGTQREGPGHKFGQDVFRCRYRSLDVGTAELEHPEKLLRHHPVLQRADEFEPSWYGTISSVSGKGSQCERRIGGIKMERSVSADMRLVLLYFGEASASFCSLMRRAPGSAVQSDSP